MPKINKYDLNSPGLGGTSYRPNPPPLPKPPPPCFWQTVLGTC